MLPVFFAAHELRFQLWTEHRTALEAWFGAVGEDAVSSFRRFRLHTQYLDDSVDPARSLGTSSAMPGYVAVDLDAVLDSEAVQSSKTWTQSLLEGPRKKVLGTVHGLPREHGNPMLTKTALLQTIEDIGWFGTRGERERDVVAQQDAARAKVRS